MTFEEECKQQQQDYGSIIQDIDLIDEQELEPINQHKQTILGNRISFEILGDINNTDNNGISFPTWKEHSMRDSTVLEAILNSVNYFVGIGVLSIPYALKAGWIYVLNMILLGIVFGITGELIGLCQQKLGSKTYPDIAEAAFGFTGRIIVSIVYYVQLLFDLVLFFNLFVTSACQLFGGDLLVVLVCVTVLMIVETHIFTTMKRASALSIVGAATGLLLCAALFLAFCVEIGLRERGVVEGSEIYNKVVVVVPSASISINSSPIMKFQSSHWFVAIVLRKLTSGGVSPSISGMSVGLPMGHTVWFNPSIKTQVVSFGIISFGFMVSINIVIVMF
jgi:hypothetical protein